MYNSNIRAVNVQQNSREPSGQIKVFAEHIPTRLLPPTKPTGLVNWKFIPLSHPQHVVS